MQYFTKKLKLVCAKYRFHVGITSFRNILGKLTMSRRKQQNPKPFLKSKWLSSLSFTINLNILIDCYLLSNYCVLSSSTMTTYPQKHLTTWFRIPIGIVLLGGVVCWLPDDDFCSFWYRFKLFLVNFLFEEILLLPSISFDWLIWL